MNGGTGAQKKAWLPRLATGEVVGTLAWLEESDRLDARRHHGARRKSRQDLSPVGSERCSSPTRTSPTSSSRPFAPSGRDEDGVTLFLVPRDTPGVTIKPLRQHRPHPPADGGRFRERRAADERRARQRAQGVEGPRPRPRRGGDRLAADSLGGAGTRPGDGGRVRQGARAVRPSDRIVPGRQAHGCRDGQRDRAGALAGVVRRLRLATACRARRRAPRRWRRPA